MSSKTPPIIVLSGPSGSGKTTLCRMAADRLGLYYAVSHTTRPRRTTEKEGDHYHFVDEKTFERAAEKGEFLETAQVYGNYYGTSRKLVTEALARGQGVILDLDPQGAQAMKKLYPKALLVFIKTPSRSHLEQRLSGRGTEDPSIRKKRLEEAEKEEASQKNYDVVLVNDALETTCLELERLVKHAQGR